MNTDVIVLGAGIVGVSAALHLQKRGRSVVLLDRKGVAEETSYGNTGIIQTEAAEPYPFPQDFKKIAKYALNRAPDANLHWSALAHIAPSLYRYWRNGRPDQIKASAEAWIPLGKTCLAEHRALMTEAGVTAMMRNTGYLRLFRDPVALEQALAADKHAYELYGISYKTVDAGAVRELEPHLKSGFAGGVLMPDSVSVGDPGALGKAYGDLFVKRGGKVVRGEARTLEATGNGWRVLGSEGPIEARDVIVALGPWADDLLRGLGVRVPMFVKRGYHMHYRPIGNAALNRPVIDVAGGYAITPMTKGIRLTTGAEFARRDSSPTPVQLAKVQPMAEQIFPLGERVEAEPWMGRRPCLPDMVPMIGPVPGRPGLWANFGHHHWGFTMGPVSGRLLAEMILGDKPLTDPAPYRIDRF
jgi:D-amino-acid dehydrogenase